MIVRDKEHTENYTVLKNEAINDSRLSFEARGVLIYLLAKPSDWNPSLSQIAKEGGMGRTRVRRIFAELEEGGYLKKSQARAQGGRFGIAELIVLETPRKDTGNVVPLPDRVVQKPTTVDRDTVDRTTVDRTTVGDPLISTIDKQVKNKTSTKRVSAGKPAPASQQKVDPLEEVIPDDVNANAWREWWEYKARGKTVPRSTVTKTVNQFLQADDQQGMVDRSIANGYRGIFPDKFGGGNGKSGRRSSKGPGTIIDTATDTSWANGWSKRT